MKYRARNMSASNRCLGLEALEGRRLTAGDVTGSPEFGELPDGFIDSPAPVIAEPAPTPDAEFGELPDGFIDSPAPTVDDAADPESTADNWGWWLTLGDWLGS